MRRLMWFAVGFAAACGIGINYVMSNMFLPLIAIASIGCLAAWITKKWWKPARIAAMVLLGCMVGLAWFCAFRNVYLLPAISMDGKMAQISVTAKDYGYETQYGTAVEGTLELEGKPYQIKLYMNDIMEIVPGDILRGTFQLRYTAPGGAEEPTFHAGKGIFLLGYQRGPTVHIPEPEGLEKLYASELTFFIKGILCDSMPEDSVPFAQALLLGDSAELDYAADTAFKISGIRHIIAVSGLHVMILYSLIHNLVFRRRYLTGFFAFPILFLFAAVAGFTPSVCRAGIMVGLMILSRMVDREYDPPTALSFAALVMLMVNPLVITSVSFQMSVGCVAGILLFQMPISNWLKRLLGNPEGKGLSARLKRGLISSVSVTISTMSLTMPLSAIHFGTVSLIGIVTNLLTLWVVNILFVGLVACCLTYYISIPLAGILGRILAYPIRYVLYISQVLSSFPAAAIYTVSMYSVAWLIFLYVLLALFLVSRRKRPAVFLGCALIGLCCSLLLSRMEPRTDDVRMTVLDVGQGQSILLQSDGKTFLIDCGGDNDTKTADLIAETLLSQGISRLDGIILTHTDDDHAGALENLLSRVDTERILLPVFADPAAELPSSIEQENQVMWVQQTQSLTYGNTEITIFGPSFLANSNENSLCVLFTRGNCDILITGDRGHTGELMLLRETELPQVDVFIVGHHGSKYANSDELLNVIRPEVAIISVGADNSYGHPAQEVLDRLKGLGCRIYRTDEQGTIIFRR